MSGPLRSPEAQQPSLPSLGWIEQLPKTQQALVRAALEAGATVNQSLQGATKAAESSKGGVLYDAPED